MLRRTLIIILFAATIFVGLHIVSRIRHSGREPKGEATQNSGLEPSANSTSPSAAEAPSEPPACDSLYQVACGRRGINEDPTGAVQPDIKGEVEALRLYEKLIHVHPDWTSDQVDEELVNQIYTPRRRQHLQDIYEWVRHTMTKLINAQPDAVFSSEMKQQLNEHLTQTRLELPPPVTIYGEERDIFTKNDVFYEGLSDGRKVIRVGGAYLLTAKSYFNRVFTFAHELAHSIDPCDADPSARYLTAYARIEKCFLRRGFVAKSAERCVNDQLSEAFADWIAVQVTAQALQEHQPNFRNPSDMLNSAVNSIRDLCNQESWLEYNTEAYPDPQVRIQTIFGKNPEVRRLLGCPAGTKETPYCDFYGN